MADVARIPPKGIIRLWRSPSVAGYVARERLTSSAASRYGVAAGSYGYGDVAAGLLGLQDFFDGNSGRPNFSQVATIRTTESFSMVQNANAVSQWAAVYSYPADDPSPQDLAILRAVLPGTPGARTAMFASAYILTGSEDQIVEPWFGPVTGGDPNAAGGGSPFSFDLPEFAWRGMIGPVNAIPLERDGSTGRLLLTGFCGLAWLASVIHENFTPSGAEGQNGAYSAWWDLSNILRLNSEVRIGATENSPGIVRPTDIGRYLTRAAMSPEAASFISGPGLRRLSQVRAFPGTQTVLKNYQRYHEQMGVLFHGLTPVVYSHMPRRQGLVFGPQHYRKARAVDERPKANRVVVFHDDSVESLSEEWLDAESILRWGVISESLVSVAPQASSYEDDIGTEAKREMMAEQAAAHARQSSAATTGAVDLLNVIGAEWGKDWRLSDAVRLQDGINESPELIVRRVSANIRGGDYSITPGFGDQADVVATIGRTVIKKASEEQREVVRLRKDVEDLKEGLRQSNIHTSNKVIEGPSQTEPGSPLPANFGDPYWIAGDEQGVLWLLPNVWNSAVQAQALFEAPVLQAIGEPPVTPSPAQQIGGGARIGGSEIPQSAWRADPIRNIPMSEQAGGYFGIDYAPSDLFVLEQGISTDVATPASIQLRGYRSTTGEADDAVTITDGNYRDCEIMGDNLYVLNARGGRTDAKIEVFNRTTGDQITDGTIDLPDASSFNGWSGLAAHDGRLWAADESGFFCWNASTKARDTSGDILWPVLYFWRGRLYPSRVIEGVLRPNLQRYGIGLVRGLWHNGWGAIYYITGDGRLGYALVPGERNPGLSWRQDYAFDLPAGSDGSTVPQDIGTVEAIEETAGLRARTISYSVDSGGFPYVRIDSATGQLTYNGPPVDAERGDGAVIVRAQVPQDGRRPALTIRQSVGINVGGAGTLRGRSLRIVPLQTYFSIDRPGDNESATLPETGAAFRLEGVPSGETPTVTVENIQAGSGGGQAGRTRAAQGSVRVQALAGAPYNYNFVFQDNDPSEIGNEVSFRVRAVAGTQSVEESFAINLRTGDEGRTTPWIYQPQDTFYLAAGETEASIRLNRRIGGPPAFDGTFAWATSDPGAAAIDSVNVRIERIVGGDTSANDWAVARTTDSLDDDRRFLETQLGLSLNDIDFAGTVTLSYSGTVRPAGRHSILIRVQGRNVSIPPSNNQGTPVFVLVHIIFSDVPAPTVILSDRNITLKRGSSIDLIPVNSFRSPSGYSSVVKATPTSTDARVVSLLQQGAASSPWGITRITGERAGMAVVSWRAENFPSTGPNAPLSEAWRVTFTVTDDVAPVWQQNIWYLEAEGGSAIGTHIGDPIVATGENVTMSIRSGNDEGLFTIANNGQISAAKAIPDMEATHTLIVRAVSNANPRAFSSTVVQISVVLSSAAPRAATVNSRFNTATRVIQIGGSVAIDFAGAWTSTQTGETYTITTSDAMVGSIAVVGSEATVSGIAAGTTTITAVRRDGTFDAPAVSVDVQVVAAQAGTQTSSAAWYLATGGVARQVSAVAASVPEGSAFAVPDSLADHLFLGGTEIAERTVSVNVVTGPAANIRAVLGASSQTLTLADGSTLTAFPVALWLSGSGLDYETVGDRNQNYSIRGDLAEYTDTDPDPDVRYLAAQARLGVNVSIEQVDEPPTATAGFSIPNQTGQVGGSPIMLSLSGAASDPDGDAIIYQVSSSNPAIVSADLSGENITLNLLQVGAVTISWRFRTATTTYQDGGSFTVTVTAATMRSVVNISFPVSRQEYTITQNTAGPIALTPIIAATATAADDDAVIGAGTYSIVGSQGANYSVGSNGQITYNGPGRSSGSDAFTVEYETAVTSSARAGTGSYSVEVTFRPLRAPRFPSTTDAMNLPSGTDGSVTPYLVGQVRATDAASYALDTAVTGFTVEAATGRIFYTGTAASFVAGDTWTVTVRATNAMGRATVDVLVTAKAVVTISFSPAAPIWKLPAGQTNVVLGSLTVIATANDVRGLPPVPTLTASGEDAASISISATGHNAFAVSYTGAVTTTASADLAFTLTGATAENGLCLAASAAIDLGVESGPAAPVFDDESYSYDLTEGTDPPPAVIVGLPTATHAAGQSQRWRIITTQTGTRLFAIDAATGAISYTGPDAADRSVATSYTLQVGCVNIEGSKESGEATQNVTINVRPVYAPPTENANWNPGSNWTKAADGSWHGTVQTGSANSVNIDITAGVTGPYALQEGLTATYGSGTVPSPPTDFSVAQNGAVFTVTGTSVGSETLYLTLSDGTTTERIVFHIQVAASTATASEAVWYTDGQGLSYDVIDEKGITIGFPEGQTTPVSRNIYCAFTEAGSRTNGSLAEPTQAGFDIVEGGVLRRQITINSVATDVYAYQINVDPSQFDYETQSRYDLTAVMNVPQATISGTTYAAVHKPLNIHLSVSNVNEPPNRTAVAGPADFDLRQRGASENVSLSGLWISEDDPDRNNLAYRLVQSVVGAQSGQSTTPGDYLTATLIGSTFQASAGTLARVTPTGVRIKFDVYAREASTGVENSTPVTFYCSSVHARALEDSPLAWGSSVPARLEFSVPENQTLPYLLRNDIVAMSTVTDPSASAGEIAYSLRDPTYWIIRNTQFSWSGASLQLDSGASVTIAMADAFLIDGADKAGKTWTLTGQSVVDSSVATVSISGTDITVTGADDLTAQDDTNFVITASDGIFVETYTGNVTVAAAAASGPTVPTLPAGYTNIGLIGDKIYASSQNSTSVLAFGKTTGAADTASNFSVFNGYTPGGLSRDHAGGVLVWTNFFRSNRYRVLYPLGYSAGVYNRNSNFGVDTLTTQNYCWDAAADPSDGAPLFAIVSTSATGTTRLKHLATRPDNATYNRFATGWQVSGQEPTAVCTDGTTFWQAYKSPSVWVLHAKNATTGADDSSKQVNIPTSVVGLNEHIRSLEVVDNHIWIVKQPSKVWTTSTTQTIVTVAKP